MRHSQVRATDHLHRALRAASAVSAMAPVLVLVYLQVMARRLAETNRSRALAVLVVIVGVATSSASWPRGDLPAASRIDEPSARTATAGPSAGVAAAEELVALLDGAAPALSDDALRPAQPRATAVAGVRRADGALSPAVIRFRPLNGTSGVGRSANVSVRFTLPMDRAATQAAFRASIAGAPVDGTFSWAEGDTVLVLDPASPFPYGARVQLRLEAGARSAGGAVLQAVAAVTFTVEPAPRPSATASRSPAGASWQWPLSGPITQYFGQSLTRYGYHYGIDIDGETGDPVRAARPGHVVVSGAYDDCGGLEVHIDHGDGLVSWYRHLSRIDVAVGASLAAGAIVGLVGNTGCSLGSHLHFAIRQGLTFVDPLLYLPRR